MLSRIGCRQSISEKIIQFITFDDNSLVRITRCEYRDCAVIDGGGDVDFSVAASSSIGVIDGDGGTAAVAVTLGESGILLSAWEFAMVASMDDFG
jgi:hypothetical protein